MLVFHSFLNSESNVLVSMQHDTHKICFLGVTFLLPITVLLYERMFFKYDDRHDILFLIFHCSFSECISKSDKSIVFSSLFCCEKTVKDCFRSSHVSRKRGGMSHVIVPNLQQVEALPLPHHECFQLESEALSSTCCLSNSHPLAHR